MSDDTNAIDVYRDVTVYQAVAYAARLVKTAGFDAENTFDHYEYRSVRGVMDAVHDALANAGVTIVLHEMRDFRRDYLENQKKNTEVLITYTGVFRVYGPAGDFFEVLHFCEGMDRRDKAANKASTAGYKEVLQKILTIPFGHDENEEASVEHDGGVSAPPRRQPQQQGPMPGWNYRLKRGVLKVDLAANKVVGEYDADGMDNDLLEKALDHAKAREAHFAKLGPQWRGPMIDAQLDQKRIRLILDERAADDMPPVEDDGDGSPSTVDRQPSTEETPPDDVPAGDTDPAKDDTQPQDGVVDGQRSTVDGEAPSEPSTVNGQPSTEPKGALFPGKASSPPNVLVSERPARIDVEVPDDLADQVATVTGLSTDELAALETVTPAEVVAMLLHPANRKLFDPALGAELAKFAGDYPPFTGPWLTYAWLGCMETRKDLKRDARKLARLAVVGLDLHERVDSKEAPEVITRRAAKDEQARVVAMLANLSSPEAARQRLSELS